MAKELPIIHRYVVAPKSMTPKRPTSVSQTVICDRCARPCWMTLDSFTEYRANGGKIACLECMDKYGITVFDA